MSIETELNADYSKVSKRPPSRARAYIFLGLLAPFAMLTFLAVSSTAPGAGWNPPVMLTTLATITGPFVGAIARNGQSCCLSCSLGLAAVAGPILALGLIAQVVPLPFRRGRTAVRLALWTLGWTVWLLSGQVSFGHALS
jgi:hypothetical protein